MIYPDDCKLKEKIIFDSHAHYTDEKFDIERDELLEQLNKNGIYGIIDCGCSEVSSKKSLNLSKKYDFIYSAVGLHPEDIDKGTDLSFIKELAKDKKCVAIGEIGLDYYWNKENALLQKQVFEEQIIIAKELDLPIIVHDREAHADTMEILLKHKPKGVVHCFSGSAEMARQIIDLGMYIGVGGVATFKNARKLPEVISAIPNDRLLIETDSPYLAPEPVRGSICHSGLIPYTAAKISEIKGIDTESVLKITMNNAKELFGIL